MPIVWGLALIASHLAAVVIIGVLVVRYHQSMMVTAKLRSASALAEQFAARLSPMVPDESLTGKMRYLSRNLAAEAQLDYAVVTDRDGRVLVHSEPGWLGRHWGRPETPAGGTDASLSPDVVIQSSDRDAQYPLTEVSAPIVRDGSELVGYVHLGVPSVVDWEAKHVFWTIVACTAVAILAFLFLMYRSWRRSMTPLTSVRNHLLAFSSGLDQDLHQLRLNSSCGQIAAAWNQLIDFTKDLEHRLAETKTRTSLSPLFDRYQQQRLQRLLDALPTGVAWIDVQEHIAYLNTRARHLLGIESDDAIGSGLDDVTMDAKLRDVTLTLVRQGGDSSGVDLTLGEGAQRTVVRLTAVSLKSDDTSEGSMILLQDVSQQKEAERARDDFLHHIAHELRTPLTNIRAYSETLTLDLLDDAQLQKECFNVINQETQRLSRLIEQILSVSQLEVGSAMIRMGDVQLDRLLRDSVQEVQAEADRKNIDLLLKLPTKVPRVRADREQMSSVLNNLLGNAIKYTPEGGQVELVCETNGDHVELTVSDTGIGIDPTEQERIFEKFYRIENEYVAGQSGTGLGLGIAREIVRLHGSDISVTSVPGSGSRFQLRLAVMDGE